MDSTRFMMLMRLKIYFFLSVVVLLSLPELGVLAIRLRFCRLRRAEQEVS